METEITKRYTKTVKNRIIGEILQQTYDEQLQILFKTTELLKLNNDLITFIRKPVKKTA